MVAGREDGLADSSTDRPTTERATQDDAQGTRKGSGKKSNTLGNFLDALLAVLAGNAIYYLSMPHLPPVARHRLFREDFGLVVDFAICLGIFAALKYWRRNEG
jgi:hypothetical protein